MPKRSETAWAVECPADGLVHLTHEEYYDRLSRGQGRYQGRWTCPICGATASWSDENYEKWADSFDPGV